MSDRRRELEQIRGQMAATDSDIVRALQKRARLAMQLRELGAGASAPPLSISEISEREIVEAIESIGGSNVAPEAVRAVLREVRAATATFERDARLALPGPEGDFPQLATQKHFGSGARLERVGNGADAMEELSRGRADFAVLPFESSREGLYQDTVDLIADSDALIAAKIEIPALISAMAAPAQGALRGDSRRAFMSAGHRALVQRFLADGTWVVRETASPLDAARAALDEPKSVALVPETLGESLGLSVECSNVGDRADLRYRFALVATRPTFRTGRDTTALLFGVHDRPGALFEVLARFAERGIYVDSIQSRPVMGDRGPSMFFVEFSGHVADRAVVTALEHLKQTARFVKVLGSFPAC